MIDNTKPDAANPANSETTDTPDTIEITDADDAQEAVADVAPAEPKPKATSGKKSAQTARRRQQGGTTKATRTKKTTSTKKPAKGASKPNVTALKDVTFAQLPYRFGEHLAEIGKSAGTVVSYSAELETAANFFGPDRKVSALTAARVQAFFASDAVTKKRGGKPKSELSIAKTCRVLRQALNWLAAEGAIKKAPLPDAK